MDESLEAEIDRIKTLGLRDLRKHWTKLLGDTHPPWRSEDFLRRTLAYKM